MKQQIKTYLAGGFLALALSGAAMAGPVEDEMNIAVGAYMRGDYVTALQIYRPLAEQGNATAQFALGTMYQQGQGVPQDYEQAFALFRKAADQNDPLGFGFAQYHLGRMYANGLPEAEKLAEEAQMEWLEEARNGDPDKRDWYYSTKPPEVEIVAARKKFGSHPDADLFFDGVTKLAEMEQARACIRIYAKEKALQSMVQREKEKLARLEREFALARARRNAKRATANATRRVWRKLFT
jgi:TPR repeat protein